MELSAHILPAVRMVFHGGGAIADSISCNRVGSRSDIDIETYNEKFGSELKW